MSMARDTHVARDETREADEWITTGRRYTWEPGGCRVVAGEELREGDVAWLDFHTGEVTKLSPIELATLHG